MKPTGEGGYQFCFFNGEPDSVDKAQWAKTAVALFNDLEIRPAFVSGKAQLVRAPVAAEAIIGKLTARLGGELNGGTNPHHSAPIDGWSLSLICSEDIPELSFAQYVSADIDLAAWTRRCHRAASSCMRVSYGYGYHGDFPRDGWFGMGMIAGKPSWHLRKIFTPDTVSNWSRAQMWRTYREYLCDVFFVNVIRNDMMERDVGGATFKQIAQRFGAVERLGGDLWIWSVPSDEARQQAAEVLAQAGLLVAYHAPDTASQVRPPRPADAPR